MSKQKKANYSEAEIAVLQTYQAGDNKAEMARLVSEVAAVTGKDEKVKTSASIRAKLSTMGLYVKEEKASATKGRKKADIAADIGAAVGLSAEEVEGLTNATAAPLVKVLAALTVEPAAEDGEQEGE